MVLGVLRSANMNTTGDQVIPIYVSKYIPRRIVVVNASLSLTTAVGGIYTAAAKGGTVVVANTQVYTALTAGTKFVDLTLAAGPIADILTANPLYFALTIAQGAAATADVYVFGDALE